VTAYERPAEYGKQNSEKERTMRLKERAAIIAGATRGIGAAFALGFAREGAKIAIGDVAEATADCPPTERFMTVRVTS
jgi:NAD(P)-dependent dehydrogenase (short-subunit alcohol dehydrogenase family)